MIFLIPIFLRQLGQIENVFDSVIQRMKIIKINTSMIQLTQLLKWSGIVDTGGQSNIIINEGLVYVNGILVKEKRKKIYPGDQLSVKGKKYIVAGDYEINDEG